jgi:hypothetical protein
MNIEQSNSEAVERMMEARPMLLGLGKACDVIPGMRENMLLHAGPPIAWQRASGPMRGAITGALIYESKAKDEAEAQELVESGAIQLEPCHHHQAVGPMAGVISPSMSVYILENKTHGNYSYSNLNEGYGKVLRYGAYSEEVLERLRWMEDVMAPILGKAIELSGGIDMRALLSESLQMGDEGHNRNKAGSVLFTKNLAPYIVKATDDPNIASNILKTLGDNALSVLNPVMAACKAMPSRKAFISLALPQRILAVISVIAQSQRQLALEDLRWLLLQPLLLSLAARLKTRSTQRWKCTRYVQRSISTLQFPHWTFVAHQPVSTSARWLRQVLHPA